METLQSKTNDMLKRRRENEELKRGTLGLVQWGKNISDITQSFLSTCIFEDFLISFMLKIRKMQVQ